MESDKSDNIKKETQNNTDKNWVNSINPQDRHAVVDSLNISDEKKAEYHKHIDDRDREKLIDELKWLEEKVKQDKHLRYRILGWIKSGFGLHEHIVTAVYGILLLGILLLGWIIWAIWKADFS